MGLAQGYYPSVPRLVSAMATNVSWASACHRDIGPWFKSGAPWRVLHDGSPGG